MIKNRKTKIIVISVLILTVIALTIALTLVLINRNMFVGEKHIEDGFYSITIDKMNGTDLYTIDAQKNDRLNVHFKAIKGSLKLEIISLTGNTIFSGNGAETSDFVVNINETGNYLIKVTAKRAKGVITVELVTD